MHREAARAALQKAACVHGVTLTPTHQPVSTSRMFCVAQLRGMFIY